MAKISENNLFMFIIIYELVDKIYSTLTLNDLFIFLPVRDKR